MHKVFFLAHFIQVQASGFGSSFDTSMSGKNVCTLRMKCLLVEMTSS